jgi:hypothetical protein
LIILGGGKITFELTTRITRSGDGYFAIYSGLSKLMLSIYLPGFSNTTGIFIAYLMGDGLSSSISIENSELVLFESKSLAIS